MNEANVIEPWSVFSTHTVGILVHQVEENVFGAELCIHLDDGKEVPELATDQKWISILTDMASDTAESCAVKTAIFLEPVFSNISGVAVVLKDNEIIRQFDLDEAISKSNPFKIDNVEFAEDE